MHGKSPAQGKALSQYSHPTGKGSPPAIVNLLKPRDGKYADTDVEEFRSSADTPNSRRCKTHEDEDQKPLSQKPASLPTITLANVV